MSFLKNLPYPNVIEQLSYDEILKNIKSLFKGSLNDDEISLLESDRFSALLETLAYRELLLRARINSAVKSMLLPFAQGADLDNIVAMYGIERKKGEKPIAEVEFSLSMARDSDVLIPKGTILCASSGELAAIKDDITIAAGQLKGTGHSVLQAFVKQSDLKCELIQTPFSFVLKARQTSRFEGGADEENDERLRDRAVLSLERFSTAGSRKAYIYHALSANAKVEEVSAINGGPGIVKLYLKTADMSEETRADVQSYLSGERVRPLCDTVVVENAKVINAVIKAELELKDMLLQASIQSEIEAGRTSLSLGEDLNLSYVYSALHREGVYRVNLKQPAADIKADVDSFVKIKFELSFAKAVL